jgi:hypothetical protein
VKKYLGTCLLSQAGVALGLVIIIETQFSVIGGDAAFYGTVILSVVTISTIILEIMGPIVAKWSLAKAGEIGNGRLVLDCQNEQRSKESKEHDLSTKRI